MGTAMVLPLCDREHEVRLVGTHLDAAIIDDVRSRGRHPKLNITLPPGVTGYHHTEFASALSSDTGLIILGVSSAGIEWAIDRLCESLQNPVPVLMVTKGMFAEAAALTALPVHLKRSIKTRKGMDVPIAAIGGPCIAGELAARRQTGTVIVAEDQALAHQICAMLETSYYHPRASADVAGVETCAAFKNFFAIGVGWAVGNLEKLAAAENRAFNHNAAAIIFGQAIRELMILAEALGGTAESVWGMPGAGDLYVTCQAGRNSRLGNHLGRGLTFRQTRDGPMKGDTIEGAELGLAAAPALRAMMTRGELEASRLPLTTALLDALTTDIPLDIPWQNFHRGGG
jgi:glycerol-3-phosphate dehydrogenase (NAD(P)+)